MEGDKKGDFTVGHDGTVEFDGVVVEKPEADILDELAPVPEAPSDPEKAAMQARLAELEAFSPLIEAIGKGEVSVVDTPPAIPDPAPIAGYRERATSPDAPEIVASMRLYREQLAAVDPEAAQRLDDDPEFFNQTFDRFRELRPAPAQPAPVPPRRDPQELERIINARESRKDAAHGMSAGIAHGSETYGVGQAITPQDAEIGRLKREIRKSPTDTDLAVALAKALGLGES